MQVRHLYVVLIEATGVETETEQITDVGRETAQALAKGALKYRSLLFNLGYLLSTEDKQQLEMSLILTVLDKLAYFLSLIAFCVSVSYSWLK